jgi:holo-ACP synthase/triphosphoribosyl-dephospho-CoA synthase
MQGLRSQTASFLEVLNARERRAQIQAELRSLYNAPVISITVNMPGNVKYNEDTISLIYAAMEKIRICINIARLCLLEERIYHSITGPTALMAVQGDAHTIKAFAISLETEKPYSRLLDIDVFDDNGRQINRATWGLQARKCLVCSEVAVDCMRAKIHSPEEVLRSVRKLMIHHRAATVSALPKEIETIGSTALEAMLLEAVCAPAPGLVDRFNSGAHKDMDIFTFVKSSSALAPAMYRCAMAAWNHSGPETNLLPVLRCIGTEAEQAMFKATGGVNTQKGLLFLMGVIVAATALTVKGGLAGSLVESILRNAANICRGIVQRELGTLEEQSLTRKLTAGERLYLSYGVKGIRGEIEQGFPAVIHYGLPSLREAIKSGLPLNDALIQTLISLIAVTEDTTI